MQESVYKALKKQHVIKCYEKVIAICYIGGVLGGFPNKMYFILQNAFLAMSGGILRNGKKESASKLIAKYNMLLKRLQRNIINTWKTKGQWRG